MALDALSNGLKYAKNLFFSGLSKWNQNLGQPWLPWSIGAWGTAAYSGRQEPFAHTLVYMDAQTIPHICNAGSAGDSHDASLHQ